MAPNECQSLKTISEVMGKPKIYTIFLAHPSFTL